MNWLVFVVWYFYIARYREKPVIQLYEPVVVLVWIDHLKNYNLVGKRINHIEQRYPLSVCSTGSGQIACGNYHGDLNLEPVVWMRGGCISKS